MEEDRLIIIEDPPAPAVRDEMRAAMWQWYREEYLARKWADRSRRFTDVTGA